MGNTTVEDCMPLPETESTVIAPPNRAYHVIHYVADQRGSCRSR